MDMSGTQAMLANLLFAHKFGDDTERNWQMAELLLTDADFLQHCNRIQKGKVIYSDSRSTLNDKLNTEAIDIAYIIYKKSYFLKQPSYDSQINFDCAWAIVGGEMGQGQTPYDSLLYEISLIAEYYRDMLGRPFC